MGTLRPLVGQDIYSNERRERPGLGRVGSGSVNPPISGLFCYNSVLSVMLDRRRGNSRRDDANVVQSTSLKKMP